MLEWKKDGWKAALCLAPMLLLMAVFTFYPIINTVISSFKNMDNSYRLTEFQGFTVQAYADVLTDSKFWSSIGFTVLLAVISVPLSIAVSLLIAVALTSIKKLKGFFQTIFFLPYVTNGIAFGLVFASIFSYNGLINSMLPQAINWIGDIPLIAGSKTVDLWAGMLVIITYTVWNGLAFKILVFVGGIEGIDKQYYQAAELDGASKWRVFRKITLPLLSPMVLYISITSLIGAFKAYSSVVSIYGESMGNGTDGSFMTAVGYIYQWFGYVTNGSPNLLPRASAAAVILFVLILIVTMLQLLYNKKRVHY